MHIFSATQTARGQPAPDLFLFAAACSPGQGNRLITAGAEVCFDRITDPGRLVDFIRP